MRSFIKELGAIVEYLTPRGPSAEEGLSLPDIPDIRNESKLTKHAELLANRIRIPNNVLSFLYENSRIDSVPRSRWAADIKTACAIDLILRNVFTRQHPGRFARFIDGREALSTLPPGTVLLTFHGAFVRLARHVFNATIPASVQVDRAFAKDSRGALFSTLRSLEEGRSILIAPDGPGGGTGANISVLGIEVVIADGAAFLAHTARCGTAWLTVVRNGERFAVRVEKGPTALEGESFAEFRQRLLDFYGSEIEKVFTGDPKNMSLTPRWRRVFADR